MKNIKLCRIDQKLRTIKKDTRQIVLVLGRKQVRAHSVDTLVMLLALYQFKGVHRKGVRSGTIHLACAGNVIGFTVQRSRVH